MDLAARLGPAQSRIHPVQRQFERRIKVVAARLRADHRTFAGRGDLDLLTRFGLSAVKNVGRAMILNLVNERKNNGEFKTFSDFMFSIFFPPVLTYLCHYIYN